MNGRWRGPRVLLSEYTAKHVSTFHLDQSGSPQRLLLAVGFAGYLHPDMRLDWAAIAQMCGIR